MIDYLGIIISNVRHIYLILQLLFELSFQIIFMHFLSSYCIIHHTYFTLWFLLTVTNDDCRADAIGDRKVGSFERLVGIGATQSK